MRKVKVSTDLPLDVLDICRKFEQSPSNSVETIVESLGRMLNMRE